MYTLNTCTYMKVMECSFHFLIHSTTSHWLNFDKMKKLLSDSESYIYYILYIIYM